MIIGDADNAMESIPIISVFKKASGDYIYAMNVFLVFSNILKIYRHMYNTVINSVDAL